MQTLGSPIQQTSSNKSSLFGTPTLLEPLHAAGPHTPRKSQPTSPSSQHAKLRPHSPLKSNLHPQASFHIPGEGICPPPEIPHAHSQEHIEETFLEGAGQQSGGSDLPWLSLSAVERRRQSFEFNSPEMVDFVDSCEFVGLGCFCGVTRSLQALGLKKYSYPFDWVRSDTPGVLRCVESNFKDFTSYSFVGDGPSPGVSLYGGAKWGGSFWHHDPRDVKVQSSFDRRIKRMLGDAEVPRDKNRVFCISLNSLSDLSSVPKLRTALEQMLPKAQIFLLVFVDNQPAIGPIRIREEDDKTLLYWIHEKLFDNMGENWSEQKHAESYAEGLATAVRVWAGLDDSQEIPEVSSYVEFWGRCNNFEGGNPSEKLYWPLRLPSQKMPRMPRLRKHSEAAYCAILPWPLDMLVPSVLRPCGNDVDEDDVEIIMNLLPAEK